MSIHHRLSVALLATSIALHTPLARAQQTDPSQPVRGQRYTIGPEGVQPDGPTTATSVAPEPMAWPAAPVPESQAPIAASSDAGNAPSANSAASASPLTQANRVAHVPPQSAWVYLQIERTTAAIHAPEPTVQIQRFDPTLQHTPTQVVAETANKVPTALQPMAIERTTAAIALPAPYIHIPPYAPILMLSSIQVAATADDKPRRALTAMAIDRRTAAIVLPQPSIHIASLAGPSLAVPAQASEPPTSTPNASTAILPATSSVPSASVDRKIALMDKIVVTPSADAREHAHDQQTITSLRTTLDQTQMELHTVTIERDSARQALAVAQQQTQTALSAFGNQRGLTAVALHDEARAAREFSDAAAHGDASAAANLALLLLDGRGMPRDPARAVALLEQAAGQGNAAAARNLVLIYQRGLGTAPNPERARQWATRATQLESGVSLAGSNAP